MISLNGGFNMPTISQFLQSLIANIITSEGIVDHWYKDTEGIDTIGVGWTKHAFEGLTDDAYRVITGVLVRDKLIKVITEFKWYERMPDEVRAVIFEMTYQMGIDGFKKFKKTINYLKNKNWLLASQEMLNSKWAKEQTPKRALRLSKIIAGMDKPKTTKIHRTNKIIDTSGKTLYDPNADN